LTTDGESPDYCLVAILILTESVELLALRTWMFSREAFHGTRGLLSTGR
jgi:hypothetical protein